MKIIDMLNKNFSYPIYVTKGDGYQKNTVDNVRGVNGKDIETVADEISAADIMATAVGVNILPYIAEPLAAGIKKRFHSGNEKPLNIIICENMLGADAYLRELLIKKMNDDEKAYFEKNIGLVEASIGRMVPATPEEIAKENILSVCVEEFCQLPVDKEAFKGNIPNIINMIPFAPFEFYIQRKLFMHNMSHALIAYFGNLKGYTYIWEAASDPEIQLLAFHALLDSAAALSKVHGVPLEDLIKHAEDLLYRFENKLLGDTIARVGKDTVRKLSPRDRLTGVHSLLKKYNINPVYIESGIAAALHFAPEDDASSKEVMQYTLNEGVAAALKKYCGLEDKEPAEIINEIYIKLKNSKNLSQLLLYLQKQKRTE
jgi:mannitol-1-phosphate 5-dehydrogenase